MILCGVLRHGDRQRYRSNARNEDDDEVLEHAALTLWKTLQSGDSHAASALDELLAVDVKIWNRMARLLFASNRAVVQAIVAVMHTLSSSHRRLRKAVEGSQECEGGTSTPACAHKDEQLLRIQEKMWRSEWRQQIIEKVRDCCAYSAQQQRLLSGCQSDETVGEQDADLCVRLLRILGAVAESVSCSVGGDGDDGDRKREGEVLSLLLSLCTSPIWRIAHCAAATLLSVLRNVPGTKLALEKVYTDSSVMECAAKWLTETAGYTSPKLAQRSKMAKKKQAVAQDISQLQCVYFDLMIHGASAANPSHEGILQSIMEQVHPLRVCTLYFSHKNVDLQEKALVLLTTILQSPLNHASAVCSSMRISGALITTSWLMGHSHDGVATAAAKLMDCVLLNSLKTDILRALVEQGCAIVYHAFSSSSASFPEDSSLRRDVTSSALNCSKLLLWMARESDNEQTLGAGISSVLRSSNALLQKNVLLSFLLLSRLNPAIKHKLESEDHFVHDVVHVAIEASEDGSLAAMLLSALLTWCDRSSALKLEDSGSSFRQQSQSGGRFDTPSRLHTDLAPSSIPPVIEIRHSNEVVAEIDGLLLHKLSKLARRWFDTNAMQPNEPRIPLDQFRVATIHLFAELLPKSQQEAVIILKQKDISDVADLLELAKYMECSKCWHFATFAMNHCLDTSNWFDVFQFAMQLRHPSLMLRAGKSALESYGDHMKNGGDIGIGMQEQRDEATGNGSAKQESSGSQRFPNLKTAAFQMFQELFDAEEE